MFKKNQRAIGASALSIVSFVVYTNRSYATQIETQKAIAVTPPVRFASASGASSTRPIPCRVCIAL